MKSSLNQTKKSIKKSSEKTAVFLLGFVLLFSFLFTPLRPVKAQAVVSAPVLEAQNVAKSAYDKAKTALSKLLLKSGATSFQQVVRTALNRIAYDTATYLGSGNNGQKPLFITEGWGSYLANVGDAAAGQFIESFVNNLGSNIGVECQRKYQVCVRACGESYSASSTDKDILTQSNTCTQACKTAAYKCGATGGAVVATGTNSLAGAAVNLNSLNVCQPSSLEAKVKIGLGLVEYRNPTVNCTASEMISNWDDEVAKVTDWKNENFLDNIKGMFDPTTSDLGIYMSARSNIISAEAGASTLALNDLIANKGWLSKKNAAGESTSVPGDAEAKARTTEEAQTNSLLRTTGDIVVDAANVFVNQYAISKFSSLMSGLGKKTSSGSGSGSAASLTSAEADPNSYFSENKLKESLSSIIKPDFGVKADYDILSNLTVCLDKNNPGPTECVIDSKFSQAVSENKTVAEAVKEGYINGNWQLTEKTSEGSYSLRNVSILRKYRILPVGWEEAIKRAYANAANVKRITVMDMISCFDGSDDYQQFSSNFDVNNQSWCRGLIDPNWVLKAPLNYCSKQGSGAQIVSKMVIPSYGSKGADDYIASAYSLNRNEEYCADEKTCIKEKADGSCEAYGYCNEEKRTWNFSSDGCDPIYNTCQSFTNASSGKNFSYLKNTLDYSGCNSSSAGCRQYSVSGSYNSSTGAVSWSKEPSVYFNNNISNCNSGDEACTELLRIKPTWGSNLVMNADFSGDEIGNAPRGWYFSFPNTTSRNAAVVDIFSELGDGAGRAVKLTASRNAANSTQFIIGIYSNSQESLLPDNFQLVYNQAYTVSADVYITGGQATLYMGGLSDGFTKSTANTGSWQHLSVTRTASSGYNEPIFGIINQTSGDSALIYIKNLKFEVSNYETGFNVYGSTYKVYEKLIPPYLAGACYNNISSASKDYTLKSDAPAVCYNYARRCNREEAGCEKFVGVKDNISVSAQVTASDYCWGDCLGYDVYIAKGNYFNSPEAANIIPATASSCRADSAGCNEFTNLDALSAGGEAKEYYAAMKRCIKPGQGTCGTFYGWEGTSSGYQLRSYSLAQSGNQPKLTSGTLNGDDCNQEVYNKKAGEIGYNADCREFYNSAGQIFYALISETITCSDDCHAYRLSEKNIDKTITAADACSDSDNPGGYYWDAASKVCYSCLNGGTWDAGTASCIYQAIPGEGKTCTAAENGCREYNGNNGSNTQTLVSYDFENSNQGWTSNNDLANVTIANEKDGHSVYYKNGVNSFARVAVGNMVTEGKSYTLRFLAKADTAANLDIFFTDNVSGNPQSSEFSAGKITVKRGGEWNIYQANLDNLDHAISENETLTIVADNDFYFDDLILTEITDRYYLLKNTSVIPDVCFYDINSVYQGEDYNLGCAQYKDRDNLNHNLRKFSKLCSNSAVGCEQVIATQNYSPYYGGIWGDTNGNKICDSNETDCVKVDSDEAMYAVFDSTKQCNSADLGCSRLGQSSADGSDWSDVFKNNNPNLYDSILCGQSELGCEKWTAEDGSESYFKDPGNEICQYRASHDPVISGKAWYKIPVKRCTILEKGVDNGVIDTAAEKAGAVCSSDSSCAAGKCVVDNNDYLCETSYFKTFGLGGAGNQVPVPSRQAGLCQATASGCTEYIDPVSSFSIGLLYNSSYELNSSGQADGWIDGAQKVDLNPNKLYILSVEKGNKDTVLTFPAIVKPLLVDNNLGSSTDTITVPAGTSKRLMFASLGNSSVSISGGETGKTIDLKEAIVNYQFKDNIDTSSCNGAVNYDTGCVLFNERNINGASGFVSLEGKFDALNSINKQAPKNCVSSETCTANKLVKVSPNRVCSKWLGCVAYSNDPDTGERVCSAVGECTRLDDKNECANFESASTGNMSFDDSGKNKNATGYYLLDNYHLSNMKEVGLKISGANYDFEDSVAPVCSKVTGGECEDIKSLIISEPEKAPTDYPAHGANYLRVPAYEIISLGGEKSLSVQKNQTYFLNFLVNTRGSGLAAKVTIKSVNGSEETSLATKNFSSSNGWTREIMSFKTPGSATKIKIYLGADNASSTQAVYFDDLNVEPVLEVGSDNGEKEYVSRECRLYPTNESLTCVNKNENVLSDGWEGYCLEHDSDNPSVCLLWYPVDKINASGLSKTNAGYQGTFPLNYCTEVNGNFELLKKIKPVMMIFSSATGINDDLCEVDEINGCNGDGDQNYKTYTAYGQFTGDHSFKKVLCVPNEKNLVFITKTGRVSELVDAGDCNSQTYSEGWAKINNGLRKEDYILDDGGTLCNNHNHYDHYRDWCTNTQTLGMDEEKNDENPVRVLDYDNPPAIADDLKFLSADGTNGDNSKIFRLTCNNFVQTVNAAGENMAWTGRVGGANAAWSTSTPPFFVENYANLFYNATSSGRETIPHGIKTYYRNLDSIPYGAASWPDSFNIANNNDGAVKLKNKYSAQKGENVFAGLPYGCSNYNNSESERTGCSHIGYCSNNPNVFCLTGTTSASSTEYVANQTCGGGLGYCMPLWTNYLGKPRVSTTGVLLNNGYPDFSTILTSLFLKSYNSYSFSKQNNTYIAGTAKLSYDPATFTECANNVRPTASYDNIAASRASFCYIKPNIGNLSVAYDKQGVYGLKFTTYVDPEQQPLKEIYIDWGDGFTQTITGQDNRPSTDNPHIFYHYYRQKPSGQIIIKIRDNWGEENSASLKI